ncbi:MAG: hypothetical protein M9920_15520 [Verrucomicrobiae bacterium]|nr:hypothetical protein [Verrucomicrobiae bacterium]
MSFSVPGRVAGISKSKLMKPLTLEQAVEKFKAGDRILIGEYRFGKAETINYLDKLTRKPSSFTAIKHTVEVGNDAFHVSERVPEGFSIESWAPPMAKGTKCLLQFDRFAILNGVGQFSGTVVPLATGK